MGTSAPVLEGRGLRVVADGRPRLEVEAVAVYEGEVLAIIGPNGAGKSTLLRILGLLEPPTAGEVRFRGEPVGAGASLLALRRRMASVFQEPLLCDTTVLRNARLGLALRGVPDAEADRRVRPWLERLGIAPLAGRSARTLSGGEAQRTSLARAFAVEPEVLLLDEPFSGLDPSAREALLGDLERILRETGTTTVFVTHDRDEAIRLGDRVAVMMGGRILQLARPEEVFAAPVSEEVARFVGVENILAGEVADQGEGLLEVRVADRSLLVVGEAARGERVLLCLRPEDIVLGPAPAVGPTSARNALLGKVVRLVPVGVLWRVVVDCGFPLTALITRPSIDALGLEEGREVVAGFKATAVHLLRRGRLDRRPGGLV
ncbi:MAG: ABC transporter ATP-binding protein [Candidatus Rokubacteria bacterium]|nr:ABC transporter ATP-binding protein [Candidatus Rokubacteria bacterium]